MYAEERVCLSRDAIPVCLGTHSPNMCAVPKLSSTSMLIVVEILMPAIPCEENQHRVQYT